MKNLPFKGSTKDWVKGTTVTGSFPNRKQRRLEEKKNKKDDPIKRPDIGKS